MFWVKMRKKFSENKNDLKNWSWKVSLETTSLQTSIPLICTNYFQSILVTKVGNLEPPKTEVPLRLQPLDFGFEEIKKFSKYKNTHMGPKSANSNEKIG